MPYSPCRRTKAAHKVGVYFEAGPHGRIGREATWFRLSDEHPARNDVPARTAVDPLRNARRVRARHASPLRPSQCKGHLPALILTSRRGRPLCLPSSLYLLWATTGGCPYHRSRKVCYGRAAGSSRTYRPEDGVTFVGPRFGPALLIPAGLAAVIVEIGAETVQHEVAVGDSIR